MLGAKKLVVWIVERVFEILAGSLLTMGFYGSNASSRFPGFLGDVWLNSVYILMFYLASGFVVSTVYFGLTKRVPQPLKHATIMAAAFLVHVSAFFVLSGGFELWQALKLAALGALIVASVNFMGARMLYRPRRHSAQD